MTEQRKKEIFPYFAFIYSKQLNNAKYGNVESLEDWTKLIQSSPKDMDEIIKVASSLTDEDWVQIENEYTQATSGENTEEMKTYNEDEDIDYMKKGAKLKKLQTMKKGKKVGAKKCSCGCDMITTKEKGGKLIYKCACGCGAKK